MLLKVLQLKIRIRIERTWCKFSNASVVKLLTSDWIVNEASKPKGSTTFSASFTLVIGVSLVVA